MVYALAPPRLPGCPFHHHQPPTTTTTTTTDHWLCRCVPAPTWNLDEQYHTRLRLARARLLLLLLRAHACRLNNARCPDDTMDLLAMCDKTKNYTWKITWRWDTRNMIADLWYSHPRDNHATTTDHRPMATSTWYQWTRTANVKNVKTANRVYHAVCTPNSTKPQSLYPIVTDPNGNTNTPLLNVSNSLFLFLSTFPLYTLLFTIEFFFFLIFFLLRLLF